TTLGTETGRTYTVEWSKPVTLGGEDFARRSDIRCTAAGAAWNSASNLVTETLAYSGAGPFNGRARRVLNPDGTATLTAYALDANGQQTTIIKAGAPNATLDDITDGTRTTTFTSAQGQVVGESVADIASGLTLTAWTATQFDALGRPTRLDHADGTYETRDYACCGLASSRDRTGTVTSWQYDAWGRPTHVTRHGVTTRTAYDADGRVKSVTRIGTDASEMVQETSHYDLAGRLTERRDALNRLTTHVESFNAATGETARTTANPDGGTVIEVTARDGSRLSVSGTAAAPRAYEYGIETGQRFTKEVLVGEGGATTEWVKTFTDFAGRSAKTVFADGATTESFYNSAGQLTRQTDPDGVATLFAYNPKGEQETVAVDVNGNGTIDYSGSDRATKTVATVAQRAGLTVHRATAQVWEADGQDAPTTVSVSERSADGLRSWETVRGLTTASVTAFDGAGGRTDTITAPDGTVVTRVYQQDRLQSTSTAHPSLGTLGSATYAHDPHGRLQSMTDARNGTTTYTYFADDQLHTSTTPDPDPGRSGPGYDPQTTTYAYDSAGRVNSVTQPDGGVVTTEYHPTGQVKKTSGARTYPVEYTYDPQGRLKTLKTWQNHAGNTGIAVTTWNYDPQRGFLLNKRYADNTGPAYTYKPSGRLLTRTWARGIVTTYGYSAAGELASVDYSDNTPDVILAYDRAGRPKTITDGAGTRTLSYHASGQLQDEIYSAGLLNGLSVTRGFDSLARLSTLSATSVPSATYQYDSASRLATVTSGANTATYGYLPNSPLVGSITFKQSGATRLTTTKSCDFLNRLISITSVPLGAPELPGGGGSASSAVSAEYDYNTANQRTRVTREDAAYWDYGYDPLGQVTAAKKSLSDGTAVLGHDFAGTFDDLGNRKAATTNGQTSAYTANLLNQYTERTVPGGLEILGAAQPD
ncbi:MAG: type IV secretion protein Rhs, partial [Pseudomonadota bacterium]